MNDQITKDTFGTNIHWNSRYSREGVRVKQNLLRADDCNYLNLHFLEQHKKFMSDKKSTQSKSTKRYAYGSYISLKRKYTEAKDGKLMTILREAIERLFEGHPAYLKAHGCAVWFVHAQNYVILCIALKY